MASRLQAVLDRRARPRSVRGQRVVLAIASVVLVAAAVVGFGSLPAGATAMRWDLVVVGAVGGAVPIALLNAVEYQLIGAAAGVRVRFGEALRVSVVASAANLLPLPGSVIVRVRRLAETGATYGRGVRAAFLTGVIWIAMTFVLAGPAQVAAGQVGLGLALGASGAVCVVVVGVWMARSGIPEPGRLWASLVVVEGAFVLAVAGALWLVLLGLGHRQSPLNVVALAIAGAVATAVGIFPGGLGLREVLAAAIGPVVGVPASVALVATIVTRLGSLVVIGGAGAVLALRTVDPGPARP